MVRACPHVGKNQRPEVDDGEAVGVHRAASLLRNEVIHHAQEACRQEEAHSVVAVPPLHHGILHASVGRVALHHACRHGRTVHNVQQRNGQDETTVEPVSNVNVLDLANPDGAEEDDGIGHPYQGNQDINGPLQFGVLFAGGVTQRQSDGSQHDDQLPAPERERCQWACEQARLAGALHHVIAGANQRRTAKGKNHCIGVQRTQTAKTQPWHAEVEFRPSKLGGDNHADQHANHPPYHGHDGELAHYSIVVVRGHICIW